MESSQSTEAIITLENDSPDVLFERSQLGHLHLWPVIRAALSRASANDELGTTTVSRRHSRSQYIRSLIDGLILPNARSSRHVPGATETLFIVNSRTNISTPVGIDNWLVGEFASNAGRSSAILQDQGLPRNLATEAQPIFHDTYSEKDLALRVGLSSRNTQVPSESVEQVHRFVREVIDRLDYPVQPSTTARLELQLLTAIKQLASYRRIYSRFLDRVQPKSVVLGNASYMNRASLVPLLRERNVSVFEPQHGWIGPAHGAYNFGEAFSEPELKAYLPDTLLTFGEFWSESIRHPSDKVAIGKASLEKAVRRAKSDTRAGDRVLLVSSVFKTEELVWLARALRARLPSSLAVVLRPHPSERQTATSKFAGAIDIDGIELDDEKDLYHSLARSKAVVGYASTVLFEALPFNIPTLVIESPLTNLYAPREVFGQSLSVDTSGVNRILEAVESLPRSELPIDVTRIWKPEAARNFNSFLDSVGRSSGIST